MVDSMVFLLSVDESLNKRSQNILCGDRKIIRQTSAIGENPLHQGRVAIDFFVQGKRYAPDDAEIFSELPKVWKHYFS